MKQLIPIILFLLIAATAVGDDSITISHDNCDANSLPAENTSVDSLNTSQFYKLCPGSHLNTNDGTYETFGQPRCGDGSNFSFYFTRPRQPQKEDKILIELSGGGACWDKGTCALQSSLMKVPPLDFILGMSCSDVGEIAEASEGWDILCARTVGQTDFTEYNTLVVPYCTQDVHFGDAVADYDGMIVQHAGAHNTYRTLQWVFENFEEPKHIVLTGCSAGAAPLPVIYNIIKEHYKAKGVDVQVNIIADSPVYLTPSDFMQNHFEGWNHETIMKSIGFEYDSHKTDDQYSKAVLDYVLGKSDDDDGIGMVSHKVDPTSWMYYFAMGGEGDWWSEMNDSWSQAMDVHENFDVYLIDGSGHCSAGLYFASKQPEFEKWVSNLLDDKSLSDSPITVQQTPVMTNASVTATNVTVDANTQEGNGSTTTDSQAPLEASPLPSPIITDNQNSASPMMVPSHAIVAVLSCFYATISLLSS